jgi:hypothetical protein
MNRKLFVVITAMAGLVAAVANVNRAGAQVVPATDQWIVSVGRGQGACPGGVCSQWRTDLWIFNPSSTATANVTLSLFERVAFPTGLPATRAVEVEPGKTAEFVDVVYGLFGFESRFGALRAESDIPVAVTARVYDANVTVVGKETGTAGQYFQAVPAHQAIGLGQSTNLVGLAQTDAFRSNFGFAEVTGKAVTVRVERLNDAGEVIASKDYAVGAQGVIQFSIADIAGSAKLPVMEVERVRLTVKEGEGRIIPFASRIDNRSGDPVTVVPVVPQVKPGIYAIAVVRSDNSVAGGMTFYVEIVNGMPTKDHLFVNISTDCVNVSAEGYGGGSWTLDPFDSVDGDYYTFWNMLVPLYTGETIAVYDQVWLKFEPDGRVSGKMTRLLKQGPEAFSQCVGFKTDYTLVGAWVGPWTPPD